MQSGFRGKLIPWQRVDSVRDGGKVMRETSLNDSSYIYHMLPWPYARMIFERSKLRLSRVDSWTDPYEKWWCETLSKKLQKLSGLQTYGLCWTTGAYDEPRWRMAAFRRRQPIVRLRSRVGALLKAGCDFIHERPGALYLGKVCYQDEHKLRVLAESVTAGKPKEVTRTVAEILLQKRIAFRFEQEVRLLCLVEGPRRRCVLVDIDALAVIDQVRVSPYASDAQSHAIQHYVEGCGITFKRSDLLRITLSI
jgi:hypothetical protein